MKSTLNPRTLIILILLTNVVPPLSIDEYAPSLPHMLQPLHSSVALMQLTITFYMLAFSISQIVCGAFSDHYGRRVTLLTTMPIFIVGSILCMTATNMNLLISGRLLQGLGVGALALTGPAIMADSFTGADLSRVSSYYSTVYSFIPICAPLLGGFIQDYFGWRANFGLMLILAIAFYAFFYFYLPETHISSEKHSLSIRNLIKNYSIVLTHKKYMLAIACMTLIWSTFIVFSVMAPFIMQMKLMVSASEYGMLALFVGLGFFVGNMTNNFLLKWIGLEKILNSGLFVMAAMSLLSLLLPLMGVFNVWSTITPIFILMAGAGLSFPHLYARAVGAVPEHAGIAGAFIGSLLLLGAVMITALLTQLHAHSIVAMASVYLIFSLLSLIIVRL